MNVEWDNNKAESNFKKHNVSFEDAALVFEDPFHLSIPDMNHSADEDRWITLGLIIDSFATVVVAHTYRDENGVESIRIISARKATSKEKRSYENNRSK